MRSLFFPTLVSILSLRNISISLSLICVFFTVDCRADRIIEQVTLDGGANVTVSPAAGITAEVTTRTTYTGHWSTDNWRSTGWWIDTSAPTPGTLNCVNHNDYSSAGIFSENFNISAPVSAGTYNAYFVAYNDDSCTSSPSATYIMNNAVVVSSPVSADLVGHWWLDSNGNEYVNGLNALPVGTVQYNSARVCSGFEGTGSGILAVPDDVLLDLPDEFSAMAWINPSSLSVPGHDTLYSFISKDNNFEVHVRNDGSIYWWWGTGSLETAPGSVPVGGWTHVAIVHSRSGGYQRIYINGVLRASDSLSISMPTNDDAFLIGGDITTGGAEMTERRFYGLIDEVRIYDGPLTQSQIVTAMNEVRSCASPLAEYRFEGCDWTTGATVEDELGNYPGVVAQGAHTAPGSDYGGGLCNVANLQNEGTDYDRHISLTGNPIPLNSDWTLMMWVNFPPGFGNHFYYSNYRYSVIAGGDHDLCWIREHTTTGERYWGASSSPVDHLAPFPSTLTGWHHLTFVGSGSYTLLYVDGVYYNSVDYKQNGNYTHIGTTADSVSTTARQNLDTQLDELKFYSGPLTANDISAIYSMENAGYRWDGTPLNCQLCGAIDHIRIEHTGIGLTCQRSDVVLRACADATCTSESTDTVTVTMTPASADPPTWISGDSYTFTGHQTVQLRQTVPGTVSLGLDNPNPVPTNGFSCYNSGVSGDCDIDFYESGFIFDVPDLTSCQSSPSVSIQAVRMDNTSQACVADAGFANVSKTVNFWSTYANPVTGTEQVSLGGTDIATAIPGTAISLNFDANATASFSVTYPDAGQMQLNARYDGVGTEEAGLVMLGADSFITRPVGLCVYSDDANADCAAGNGSCSVFKKVDENFNLKVKGVCWETAGDTDYCTGNSTTRNFQLNTIPITHSLIAPTSAGVSTGSIGVSSIDMSAADNGEHVISNQTVSEVGVFTFTATPPNYFGNPLPAATSTHIGRFTPDHFITVIADHGVLQDGCSGFTYSGQPFSYDPPNYPEMSISAVGSGGNTTVNYRDDFIKLTDPSTQISMPAVTSDASNLGADGSTLLNLTWSPAAASLTPNDDGTLNFTLGADQFIYTRESNALVAPINSDIRLPVLSISDSDGIIATDLPRSFVPAGTEIRYGRMQLQNAYGPETMPLTIPVVTEFYDGAAFIPNVLDSCTPYDSLHLQLSNYQGNLASGDTIATGNGTLISGIGSSLSLSAPGVGHEGSVELMLDLSQATGLALDWLQPGGNNPTAKATFGIFKGNQRLIYMRESIW